MKNRNLEHSDNWETPKWLYDELTAEFNFDFDPCPLNAGIITPEKNGLFKDWGKSNFINPPYSRKLKEAFIHKAVLEAEKGKLCVCLLPISTSTDLFHNVILKHAREIRFIKGRVRFNGINTRGEVADGNPMHDSMIVVFEGRHKNRDHVYIRLKKEVEKTQVSLFSPAAHQEQNQSSCE